MGFLGNTPAERFTAVTKDSFDGDGSTVAFTLSRTSSTNGVEVFVNNVQQEPTTAYSISGTTLTFTAAPATGTGNIYVLHRNSPVSTITHPPGSALEATNGTFTGNLTVSGTISGDGSSLTGVDSLPSQSGNSGSVLVTNGTSASWLTGATGRRNLIINGAMQVAQRGTSATGITNGNNGYHTVDRWEWRESSTTSSVWTIAQVTDAPNGFPYSIKATATTGASTASGNLNRFRQSIEAQNLQSLAYGTSDAKQLTVSFYVKSNKTGTANVALYAEDANDLYAANYTIDTADTWEHKTITYSANTSGSITNDNGVGFWVDFIYAAGSDFTSGTDGSWATYDASNYAPGQTLEVGTATNDYFAITGVQLEVGSVATPFEHRSYGEELALCQRYYFTYGTNDIWCQFIDGNTTTRVAANVYYPTTMRASPTLTYDTPNVSTAISGNGTQYAAWLLFNSDSANRGGTTYIDNFRADAEL